MPASTSFYHYPAKPLFKRTANASSLEQRQSHAEEHREEHVAERE